MCRKCFPLLPVPCGNLTDLPWTALLHCSKVVLCEDRIASQNKTQLFGGLRVQFASGLSHPLPSPPQGSKDGSEGVKLNYDVSTCGLFHFQRCCGKSLDLLIIFFKRSPADVVCIRLRKARITMSFWGKQHWDRIISNPSLTNSLHGGSVPNLLSPPRSESSRTLKTRVSMDFLRDWASDLGSLNTGLNLSLSSAKWPSLVTVCKWKQSLTEKLKKRASAEEPQVRKHGHLEHLEALESLKKKLYFFMVPV